ncbi:MAG: type II secretion system F family protein [Actinomycetota bacterium]|nr:type II secretion system F family protein [Actinomycetota bacterium]
MTAIIFAMLTVGLGLALIVGGYLARGRSRNRELAQILELPYGERDVPVEALSEHYSPLVESTIGLAGKAVKQFDTKGSLAGSLERARIPLKPGEFVLVAGAAGLGLAAVLMAVTGVWVFALVGLVLGPLGGRFLVQRRITKRRKDFEEQLPDALTLIASSLSAGHTFLRAIQMMCEEAEEPLAEEFERVVSETRLGDPLVEALARMAERLDIRDLDWVVQAIRIQQTVGGKLADLLHTLADFIRARDEVRREVKVLTAEGRISSWVLGAMPPLILVAFQIMNPEYMAPMWRPKGLILLTVMGIWMTFGMILLNRMTKIEV